MTTFRTKENLKGVVYDEAKKDRLFVEDLHAIEEAINAIEEALGPSYVGAFLTLTERLADIESRLSALE